MLAGKNNEEKIWNYLKGAGLNDFGTAGLMGNLYAESGLIPKYDYVVQMLEAKGIKVTAEVKAMIEAAVKELDIAVDSTIGTLGGIFVEDNPGKTDGEKELNN